MHSYDEFKEELVNISKILEKFPSDIQSKVYDHLVAKFLDKDLTTNIIQPSAIPKEHTDEDANEDNALENGKQTTNTKKLTKSKSRKSPQADTFKMNLELDLTGSDEIQPFRDFNAEKKPKSNMEFNAISIYYLETLLKHHPITLDDVYTCYKLIGKKPAKYFRQSFTDTKNQKGWINNDKDWNLKMTHIGISFVEHDLPSET